MILNISFTGQWEGEFVYGSDYGDLEGEMVSFMLFLEGRGNQFEGKAFDIDGVGAQSEVATVRGFYEKGTISFIKQYPLAQEFQEDGSLKVIENKKPPEIHYNGEYYEGLKMFKGKWEMVWAEEKVGEGYYEYINTGTWQMKREED